MCAYAKPCLRAGASRTTISKQHKPWHHPNPDHNPETLCESASPLRQVLTLQHALHTGAAAVLGMCRWAKQNLTLDLLKRGYNVHGSDVDVVYFRNVNMRCGTGGTGGVQGGVSGGGHEVGGGGKTAVGDGNWAVGVGTQLLGATRNTGIVLQHRAAAKALSSPPT